MSADAVIAATAAGAAVAGLALAMAGLWIERHLSLVLGDAESEIGPAPKTARNHVAIMAGACVAIALIQQGVPVRLSHTAAGVWFGGLLLIAFVDARTTYIPDILSLGLLWAGLMLSCAGMAITSPEAGIVGVVGIWLVLRISILAVAVLGRRPAGTEFEGIAAGDVKLMAAVGAWCGLPAALAVALLGMTAGLLVRRLIHRNANLPACSGGPYLAGAAIAVSLSMMAFPLTSMSSLP